MIAIYRNITPLIAISSDAIKDNAILDEAFGDVFDIINSSNILVFKCFKYIFKHFTRSIGGWISLGLILAHIAMTLVYLLFEAIKCSKYIYTLTKKLCAASKKMDFPVKTGATYVSFYGYPRIETKSELKFYNKMGWDVVGQTCDPEATFARLNQICYAGVAVQIDDPSGRADYINNLKEKQEAKVYVEDIKSCRKRTTKIILQFLKDYKKYDCDVCCKMSRKNKNFREFPDYFYE